MHGLDLLKTLIESTGLPDQAVKAELDRLLIKHAINPETITLDDLRLILADYLQDVLIEAKEA